MTLGVPGLRAPGLRARLKDLLGWAVLVLYAGALGSGAALVLGVGLGSGYYALSRDARVEHPLHDWLRSGGPVGVLLGVVGATLMTVMLVYSVRKVLGTGRMFRWLGAPAWWLRFHMICGVLGPVAILLHTGLQWPHGLVAVGFWCMVLVALSGTFGRFVYGHFPRTAAGKAMDLREAREALAELRAKLVAETSGADAEAVGAAVALVHDFEPEVRGVVGWLAVDLEVRRRSDLVRVHLARAKLDRSTSADATEALLGQLRLQRNVAAWDVSRRLFRWWHLFHEPLAQAMYLVVAVHVASAVLFGGALEQLRSLIP